MIKIIATKVVVIQIFLISIAAYKYDILFRDETVFSRCDNPDVHYIDEYIDLSNITFEFLSNGSLYFHGFYKIIKDLGSEDNPMKIQLYKKVRGHWIDTIYNIHRSDFSKASFDANELWYRYMKDNPLEEQTCPLYKGKMLYISDASDLTVTLGDSRLGGEYKIQTLIRVGGINETVCVNILTEVYKH